MKAINNFVIGEILEDEEVTSGGIILTNTTKNKLTMRLKVKSVGEDVFSRLESIALEVEPTFKVDDVVIVHKQHALGLGNNLSVVKGEDILAVE